MGAARELPAPLLLTHREGVWTEDTAEMVITVHGTVDSIAVQWCFVVLSHDDHKFRGETASNHDVAKPVMPVWQSCPSEELLHLGATCANWKADFGVTLGILEFCSIPGDLIAGCPCVHVVYYRSSARLT